MVKIYHPKGSMCSNCERAHKDCSKFDFKSMPVMRRYSESNNPNEFVIVRCVEFKKADYVMLMGLQNEV